MSKATKKRKLSLSVLAVIGILIVSFSGTLAYLTFKTNGLHNIFKHAIVNVTIDEKFESGDIRDGSVNKVVRYKNDTLDGELSLIPIYVRAKYVATWVTTKDGKEVIAPVDAESLLKYNLNLNNSIYKGDASDVDGEWVKGDDGYFYFTGIVDVDCYTDYLLSSVELKEGVDKSDLPDEGHLEMDVLVDAIQTTSGAANDAWSNPTSGGKLIYQN